MPEFGVLCGEPQATKGATRYFLSDVHLKWKVFFSDSSIHSWH